MPPVIYHLGGGDFLVPAVSVLVAALVAGAGGYNRWLARLILLAAGLAGATIVVSAAALPWWFNVIWAASTTTALAAGPIRRGGKQSLRVGVRALALSSAVAAAATEVSRERLRPLPAGRATTLYVIGDSVTAGLGRPGEVTWPRLLGRERGVRIVDLSRAGSTVAQALSRLSLGSLDQGIVLIEVGGNDIIGRASVRQFGLDLERLARASEGSGRQVVMVELPRFPFDDGYGVVQRRVASGHGIWLIPRRHFAAVLAGTGSTIDGVHLSNAGQRRLADLIWRVVGPAMRSR